MNEELLLGCFEQLRTNAASGIDGVTKEQYAEQLPENLRQLVDRLHRMAYIPQPVMRVYIPKPGSDKMRPLGVPALEDKLVQAGLVKILQAIVEPRLHRRLLWIQARTWMSLAPRALSQTVENQPVNYLVEADIRGFPSTSSGQALTT